MRHDPKAHRSRTAMTRAAIEALECRQLLATFTATSGNDIIDVFNWAGGGMAVRINGTINTTPDTSITINAGNGNDTFNTSSSRAGTTIFARGEGGSDTLVNPAVEDLDSVYVANFQFDGGTGTDAVIANNIEDATTFANIDIDTTTIAKNSDVLITYTTIESLEYSDSDGGNRIGFLNMQVSPANIALTIRGNAGNDTIHNSRSTFPNDGFWPTSVGTSGAFIDGGIGTDTLVFKNTSGLVSTYTFNSNTFDVDYFPGDTGTVTYIGCDSIDLTALSSSSDFIELISKPSGTSIRVDGGGGNDNFTVGNNDFDDSGLLLATTTLAGGAGSDLLTIADQADVTESGEVEDYTWTSTTFAKGTAGFGYSGFESQQLVAANGLGALPNVVPQVNLSSIVTTMGQTSVAGGAARACTVNVGNGTVSSIFGAVFLTLGGGMLDGININDNLPATNQTYRVAASQLTVASKVINYSGARGGMSINGGSGANTYLIDALPANTALLVNAGAGNDSFTLGSGDVDANLGGRVQVNAGSGADSVVINNTLDNAPETHVIGTLSFTDGITHNFNQIETMVVNEGPGGTTVNADRVIVPTTINGGNGNDSVIVGGGDLDLSLPPGTAAATIINGGGGQDEMILDDVFDTVLTTDVYTFSRPGGVEEFRKTDATDYFVRWSNLEQVTLEASNAPTPGTTVSTIFVTDATTPLRVNGNAGNDRFAISDASSPVNVHTGLGGMDELYVNADNGTGDAPVTVLFEQSDDVEILDVRPGGTLRVGPGATLVKTRDRFPTGGFLSLSGVIDLAGGAFLSRAGGPTTADLQAMLARGFNSGAWNGVNAGSDGAINSSLAAGANPADAVGYGLGSDLAITSIYGFSIEPGDILLRYTLFGDADLNQVVDFDDYVRTDSGLNGGLTGWANGDFDFNNSVDFDDYVLIDLGFNGQ